MTVIKAVAPYHHPGRLNFKAPCYEAWVNAGGRIGVPHYPPRWLHAFAFKIPLPRSPISFSREARLRFMEPVSMYFDAFPDYAIYETIPFLWDCWPHKHSIISKFLRTYRIRTAIVTSSQAIVKLRLSNPGVSFIYCPEGADIKAYSSGKLLQERPIDLIEFGRSRTKSGLILNSRYVHCDAMATSNRFPTPSSFRIGLSSAKVTIALPKSVTHPEIAQDIETLTQRYWECMLSRLIMVGKAPRELIDLIGYNPVIDIDKKDPGRQIEHIVDNISDYQVLADHNYESALQHGSWDTRIKALLPQLLQHGYQV